jgi:hypothetical protein
MQFLFTGFFICITQLLFAQKEIKHFIYVGMDREQIHDSLFLNSEELTGAQIRYTWTMLEPSRDEYEFETIEKDLNFLAAHHKQLFIQLSDVTFDTQWIAVPKYLRRDSICHGGANIQYEFPEDDESKAIQQGWVARRWDPAVRDRFKKLLQQLAKKFDGRIAGINLSETSVGFGKDKFRPPGFSYESYAEGIRDLMKAMKRSFVKSDCIIYANFMPGDFSEGRKADFLAGIYSFAAKEKVGIGGPDLLPYKYFQMKNSYPLIHQYSGTLVSGVAVQEGNYQHINPKTKKQVTVKEIYDFAKDYLNLNYIFWCTEAPFYKRDVIPFLRELNN